MCQTETAYIRGWQQKVTGISPLIGYLLTVDYLVEKMETTVFVFVKKVGHITGLSALFIIIVGHFYQFQKSMIQVNYFLFSSLLKTAPPNWVCALHVSVMPMLSLLLVFVITMIIKVKYSALISYN